MKKRHDEKKQTAVFKTYDKCVDVLDAARKKFLKYEGVIGVGYGPKETHGEVHDDRPSLVVYVREKKNIKQLKKPQIIPKEFMGVPIDVVVPGQRQSGHAHADSDFMWLDSGKIHELNPLKNFGIAPLTDYDLDDVAVMEIDDSFLVDNKVDWAKAVKRFLQTHPDVFDFITFYVDTGSGIPGQGSWHRGVYNKTSGLNYYAGSNLDNRAAFGSNSLRAIHSIGFLGNYVLLQETGHMWGAFVRNRDVPAGPNRFDLLISNSGQGLYHWGRFFDNDHSPMDYDGIEWQALGGNLFRSHGIGDEFHHFCPLDLYLMGLTPGGQVGSFYVIDSPSANSGLITGTRKNMTLQNVVWAEGNRNPAYPNTQKVWKQAFVVLTKDLHSVRTFAEQVAEQRREYTWQFYKSTRYLGKVDTTLRSYIRFPEINDIKAAANDTSAIIGWKTDTGTKGRVNFGLSPALFRRDEAHSEPFSNELETTFSTNHGLVINGLTPNTKYYYEIIAESPEGLVDRKGVESFCTRKTADVCPPDIHCVTINRNKIFGKYKVTVRWETDEPTDGKVCYGTSNPPDQEMYNPYPTTQHSFTLKGLSPGTYCIIVKSKDAAGNETIDDNGGFCYSVVIPPDVPDTIVGPGNLTIARSIININRFVDAGDTGKAIELTSQLFVDAAGDELARLTKTMKLPKNDLEAGFAAMKSMVENFEANIEVVEQCNEYIDFSIDPDPLRLITCIKLPTDVIVQRCGYPVLSNIASRVRKGIQFEPHPTKGVGYYRLSK